MGAQALGASYRDPSGFVYTRDGTLYRQVNRVFQDRFQAFLDSGLYADLEERELLVRHRDVPLDLAASPDAVAVLEPQLVDFVSYPYEWSFGQLRDAALLTLDLQERALARGFTLRDASAYNVQFVAGRPLFIDTLSFEPREEGAPWAGYRQFCEHFLVPLALMSRVDVRAASLLRAHLEGIPLDLGSRMLPRRTWLRAGLLFHVHLHAMAQRRYADRGPATTSDPPAAARRGVSATAAAGLVRSLRSSVESLDWTPCRHRVGRLHPGQQLLPRRGALQARPGARLPAGARRAHRVGPRRQYRRVQPGRPRGGAQRRRLRPRPGRGGAQLPPGARRG